MTAPTPPGVRPEWKACSTSNAGSSTAGLQLQAGTANGGTQPEVVSAIEPATASRAPSPPTAGGLVADVLVCGRRATGRRSCRGRQRRDQPAVATEPGSDRSDLVLACCCGVDRYSWPLPGPAARGSGEMPAPTLARSQLCCSPPLRRRRLPAPHGCRRARRGPDEGVDDVVSTVAERRKKKTKKGRPGRPRDGLHHERFQS